MQRLVMFDVDGTLTSSTAVDGSSYAQAVAEHLGVQIDTDWSTYRHVTDSGIATELFERQGRGAPDPNELNSLRQRFLSLLSAALAADPGSCSEVPGARVLIERLRNEPGLSIAVATGGWKDSACLKLRHAGLPFDGIAFASADDAVSRAAIMTLAYQRAAAQAAVDSFDSVTYVGDRIWDVRAARSLGFRFVGVAADGRTDRLRAAGSVTIIRDFTTAEPSLFY